MRGVLFFIISVFSLPLLAGRAGGYRPPISDSGCVQAKYPELCELVEGEHKKVASVYFTSRYGGEDFEGFRHISNGFLELAKSTDVSPRELLDRWKGYNAARIRFAEQYPRAFKSLALNDSVPGERIFDQVRKYTASVREQPLAVPTGQPDRRLPVDAQARPSEQPETPGSWRSVEAADPFDKVVNPEVARVPAVDGGATSGQGSDTGPQTEEEKLEQQCSRPSVPLSPAQRRQCEAQTEKLYSQIPVCFYSGFPSGLSQKRKRYCERIQTPKDALRALGEKSIPGFDKMKSCGKGMVMCNPLLVGAKLAKPDSLDGAQPFCVRAGKNATATCETRFGKAGDAFLKLVYGQQEGRNALGRLTKLLEVSCGQPANVSRSPGNDKLEPLKDKDFLLINRSLSGPGSAANIRSSHGDFFRTCRRTLNLANMARSTYFSGHDHVAGLAHPPPNRSTQPRSPGKQ